MSTNYERIKSRLCAFCMTVMMIIAVFAVLPTIDSNKAYAVGEKGIVNADSLNVRTGAGTSYKSLGTVKKGYAFTVTGTANDKTGTKWYKFSYNSKNGYVSSKFVDIKQGSVIPMSNTQGKVNTSRLNVRTGAGNWFKILGGMANGKTFKITGKVTNKYGVLWYRLTFNGKNAYVNASYVTTSEINSYTVTAVSNTKGTVTANNLFVRTGPGTTYNTLGKMPKNTSFNITGKAKDNEGTLWYRLTFNGKTGFVHSGHVTTKSTSNYTVTEIKDTKGIVTSGPLNVRKGPGSSYEILGTMAKNKSFDVTGKAKDKEGDFWYRLTFSGKTGFVHSDFVRTVSVADSVTIKTATVTSSDGLNIRSGPGTSYSVLTCLNEGTVLTFTGSEKDSKGNLWYKYKYSSSKTGYFISDYVKIRTVTSDSTFETYLEEQGFPDSYKNNLRLLHADHPDWVFKAVKLDYSWTNALDKQSVVGRNLVSSSAPKSHRSKEPGSYNSKTGVYSRFDGSWYSAHRSVIAHYMDPRNFLSESSIYQFMDHKFDSGSQSAATVKAVIKGSFMEGKDPAGDYTSYQALIYAAGKNSGVNPNVLAAMIIQEQGWSGSALCSGTYSGYKGYYNFFNVGAYTTSTMSAVQRGLWYAKQQGWNSPYKAIIGGAKFYGSQYVNNDQDSYYTKKFNIKNGLSSVGTHQYMTFVAAAASEGAIVKRAYNANSAYPIIFEIPVYKSMPAVACQLPN